MNAVSGCLAPADADTVRREFAPRLIRWQRRHGRHGLPWQGADAYGVWLSEIMLQQTQVATVLDYYPRFRRAFPDVASLAAAPEDEVLRLWAGLGYYSRARNLHKAAAQVSRDFGGRFPAERSELEKLAGVGRSTAAAIAAFAFGRRETILDGNVKRVLCRLFALDGDPADKAFARQLWQHADQLLPPAAADMAAYTQGLMDLGATVCRRSKPDCAACPMHDICAARRDGRTAELPRKKSTAAVKQQTLYWLDLRRADGSLLLAKRPPKGIWAGLYCLPSFDSLAAAHAFAEQCGCPAAALHEESPLSHRLTHRLLEIIPLSARIRQPAPPAAPYQWVSPAQLPDYGLPKPLERYLQHKAA